MTSDQPTFSESWHRVANQRLRLRRGVRVRRQNFRGERWHVIEDPLGNRFFRVRPEAYDFIARLDGRRTVQDVWDEGFAVAPETAPGQQEAVSLLGQLYQANLLHYDMAGDAEELFRRFRQRREREIRGRLLGIMFTRLPLFDPDRLLGRLLPFLGWIIGPIGALIWFAVIGLGLKQVADHWTDIISAGRDVLAPGNILLLYGGLMVAKLLHEMGHGLYCKKFGGEVHTLGLMFLIFTPVPYVDVTSSWSFRSRWQRILVGAAGMIVENFLAAIAVMIWVHAAPGTLKSFCYNIMFVTSVSTLIFNLNPLLRFDGYYILSDLLDVPNLQGRAAMHLKHLWRRYVWGLRTSRSPATTTREKGWLTVYGILSGVYRVVVFAGVLLVVADKYLLLGAVMAVACVIGWIIVPAGRLIKHLSQAPELERVRTRAVWTSLVIPGGVLAFLALVPFPAHFEAPGLVETSHYSEMVTEAPGQVVEMPAQPGATAAAGDVMVRLQNPELEAEARRLVAAADELAARLRQARADTPADVEPLEHRLAASRDQQAEIDRQRQALDVTARQAGRWSFLPPHPLDGVWLPRGTSLGVIVDPTSFEFVAAVKQTDADRLFAGALQGAEVRIIGQAGENLIAPEWRIVPGARTTLPSPALGARGGGDVPVKVEDTKGIEAAEPFYLVRGHLGAPDAVSLRQGQLGRIRFRTGNEPLLPRWWRQLRQVLQSRYKI